MLGARGIKAFADSIDTEEIKAYGTVLIGVSTAYVAVTKGTLIASKAMLAFNKVSKKNIGILAGMLVAGAVLDRLNVFAESTGDVADEIARLAGEIDNLNNKSTTSAEKMEKLQLVTEKRQFLANGLRDISLKQALLEQERISLQERYTVAVAGQAPFIEKSIEYQIEENELAIKTIELQDVLKNAKLQGASSLASSLANLNTMAKGNAKVSKRLAQASAVIDTYAGANKAFAQGGVLGFLTGSAIIAQGLANVAQIEAQKFEKGGEVGGRRHSQGGTMIEAERGEFVMSRSAVQSVGVEALNQMNQGGGGGLTLNISAPLVDETIIDTIIPAIQKAQRMNLA